MILISFVLKIIGVLFMRSLITLFLILFCLPLMADKHYAFTPIDVTQGLSGNKVRNIAQLPDGRMMITTEGQLNIYDGTRFNYLHYDSCHSLYLSEYAGYHHDYLDDHGYMWLKNWYQLMVVDVNHERLVVHPDSLFREWGVTEPLKDFFMDKSQNLWLVTSTDDLVRIDRKREHSEIFLSDISVPNGVSDQLYDIGLIQHQLFLFYRSGLLICYDLGSRKEIYRRSLSDYLSAGTYGATSYIVFTDDCFYQLCNGPQGSVMLVFDTQLRQWRAILETKLWLNDLSIDKDHSIWVCCRYGLWNIDLVQNKTQYIPTLKLVDGRRIDTEVSTLCNDNQGGLWVGTANRGILYYHPDRFRFQNIGKALFPLRDDQSFYVTGFSETDQSEILVKTNAGTYLYNPQTGNMRLYGVQIAESSVDPLLSTVLPDRPVLQSLSFGKDTLVGITHYSWFLYDKKGKHLKSYNTSHVCNTLYIDASKRLWVGTEDGLLLYDLQTGKQRMFYTSDGLVNNSIRSITQTSDGHIWLSTAGGISSVTVHEEEGANTYQFVNFNHYDGVITDEFCERSVFQAIDGTLYWGGINGFNRYVPGDHSSTPLTGRPLFVGFSLAGELIECGKEYQGRCILKQPLIQTHEIVLDHDQNFFTLEFTALNYINPTQTYYRYQLVGVDKAEREIHSSDGRGYATYTDLPAGQYVFRVQAIGNGSSWNGQYAEIRIIIKALFWYTPLAWGLYISLFIILSVGVVMAYWRRKRRKLVREQKEKLDEMKSVFLQNMHSELAEPVDRIITPLDTVLKRPDELCSRKQLQHIRQDAVELKSLISQLSEGILLPVSSDENSLNMEELQVSMRQLLEQQEQRKKQALCTSVEVEESFLSASDEEFLRKALAYVEQNIDNIDYSVEVLSHDMGMDRTSLYRRLVTVAGKTPTNFIRSIRLKRAAQLFEQGYTVAEVADSVGFSTSSYLSKCFLEEFGMRPTQYANKRRKE